MKEEGIKEKHDKTFKTWHVFYLAHPVHSMHILIQFKTFIECTQLQLYTHIQCF